MSADAGTPPLFQLEAATLRLSDGSELGPLEAELAVDRLVLMGDWTPWFDLLAQRASLVSGRAELAGRPMAQAVREGVVGLSLCDPPLPETWTVKSYFSECAALAGRSRREAARLAEETLRRFELQYLAGRPLPSLRNAERRVVGIAAAVVTSPRILCCELPFSRLEDTAQTYVETALARACQGRAAIVSLSRVPAFGPERALLERAGAVLALERGRVTRRSSREVELVASQLIVTVSANGEAFARALRERKLSATPLGRADVFLLFSATDAATDFQRFAVTPVDTRTAAVVIEAAGAASAPIVELMPEA